MMVVERWSGGSDYGHGEDADDDEAGDENDVDDGGDGYTEMPTMTMIIVNDDHADRYDGYDAYPYCRLV